MCYGAMCQHKEARCENQYYTHMIATPWYFACVFRNEGVASSSLCVVQWLSPVTSRVKCKSADDCASMPSGAVRLGKQGYRA